MAARAAPAARAVVAASRSMPQQYPGARVRCARAARWRAQCLKWRRCVKIIEMPAASAASTTSWSRLEPPGWMIAVTPASTASCGPSENGKNASEASAPPVEVGLRRAGLVDREPDGVDAAHLAGADADRREVLREHDRVRAHVLADLPGEQHLAPLALGRLALGDDLHLRAVLEVHVAVLDEHAAEHALDVALGDVDPPPLAVLEDAQVRLAAEDLDRLVGEARRDHDLDELVRERLGERARRPAG